jgi:hypothetical protein
LKTLFSGHAKNFQFFAVEEIIAFKNYVFAAFKHFMFGASKIKDFRMPEKSTVF